MEFLKCWYRINASWLVCALHFSSNLTSIIFKLYGLNFKHIWTYRIDNIDTACYKKTPTFLLNFNGSILFSFNIQIQAIYAVCIHVF